MSKILILNGSPRKNGNTERLAHAFAEGAETSGHTVTMMNICQMNINPCIGCLQGGKDKNSPCTQKDDMDLVYKEFMNSDVLVLASPMYCWSFTAQLKAVIDRIFALTEAYDYRTPFIETVMLIAAEGDDEGNSTPILNYYRTLVEYLQWKDRGTLIAGGVLHIGDIEGKDSLNDARKMGASL